MDLALFSAGAEACLQLAPLAVQAGAVVIDNSSAWRMDPACPLVVPEVNPQALAAHRGLIANPNCSTIQLVVALQPLHEAARIRRVVVATYQAVSGAGKKAVEELAAPEPRLPGDGTVSPPQAFAKRLAFNAIPQIDVFLPDGSTKEEQKMVRETAKIMGDDTIRVSATCVRVPVFYGHSEAVNLETQRKLTAGEARTLLRAAPGLVVLDEPERLSYPLAAEIEHSDAVYVGRIREDRTLELRAEPCGSSPTTSARGRP